MAWTHFIESIDGEVSLILFDLAFVEQSPVAQLHRLVEVHVWCRVAPRRGHFWNPEETSRLDEIENDLLHVAQAWSHGWAVYVLRICPPGIRKYYFYAGEHAEFEALLPHIRELHPDYRIEGSETEDRGWEHYKSLHNAWQESIASKRGLDS